MSEKESSQTERDADFKGRITITDVPDIMSAVEDMFSTDTRNQDQAGNGEPDFFEPRRNFLDDQE